MKYSTYELLQASADLSIFDFISIGPKGPIHKRIAFQETIIPEIYNLSFGDINKIGEYDDFSVSDNGDRDVILATVANIVEIYLMKYPNRWISFEGSTRERTRLYRMAIGINLKELSVKFDIYTQVGGRLVPFLKNMPVDNFVVTSKKP
ncbi:hypothetical protein CLV51_101364 [Chitinophaga niastensis]|uniref:Uncharacterized protein n=1 Tax=Chitinophaga niastensis TaxID=536980 RepID=A0A2P8HS82_CHINA|nr:hypothetical protein [Chitinophaga niastensis]PSL49034.1 hypothetical protein CLV51_101364 [Chitinophaga niastensis]